MMRIALFTGLAIITSGCAAIPNTLTPTLEHMSHATQHAPFAAHPTEYGANIAQLEAGWQLSSHVTLTLAEGISLDRHYPYMPGYGEIVGPREQFTARIGYTFTIRK